MPGWFDPEHLSRAANEFNRLIKQAEERGPGEVRRVVRNVEEALRLQGRSLHDFPALLEKMRAIRVLAPAIMEVTGTATAADIAKALEGLSAEDKAAAVMALRAKGVLEPFEAQAFETAKKVLASKIRRVAGRPVKTMHEGEKRVLFAALDSAAKHDHTLAQMRDRLFDLTRKRGGPPGPVTQAWMQFEATLKMRGATKSQLEGWAANVAAWEYKRDLAWQAQLERLARVVPYNGVEGRGVVLARQKVGLPLSTLDLERAHDEYWTRGHAPVAKPPAPSPAAPSVTIPPGPVAFVSRKPEIVESAREAWRALSIEERAVLAQIMRGEFVGRVPGMRKETVESMRGIAQWAKGQGVTLEEMMGGMKPSPEAPAPRSDVELFGQ